MVTFAKPISRAYTAWESFSFSKVDAAPLALFRIVFGAYLFYYYLDLFPFLHLHYFPPALLPPQEIESTGVPSVLVLFRYGTVPRYAAFLLTLAAALALALGLQTRLAAVLSWLLNQSLVGALPYGRNSGDNVVAVACFLFMIAALAGHAQRAHSVDARGRARVGEPFNPAWSLRLFQIQLVYVYFFSGFHKLASNDWYTGEALFYVFQQRGWSRLDLSFFTHPVLVGAATYGTLLFELLVFPVLVWVRSLRPFVLLAGVAFHLGIAATMRVFVFGEIMPLLYLSFVDSTPVFGWLSRCRALVRRRAAGSRGASPSVETDQS